jgi:hypothetical protein
VNTDLYTIRGRKKIAYIFFLFLALPLFIALLTGDFAAKGFLFLFVPWFLLSIVIYMFCKRTQIVIQPEGFAYHSPYGKKNFVRWTDIKASSLEVSPQASTVSFTWKFETFLGKQINIELGYFSRNDMKLLAAQVVQQTKGALLSNSIYRMAKGQFPWYIF